MLLISLTYATFTASVQSAQTEQWSLHLVIIPQLLRVGALSDDARLTSVTYSANIHGASYSYWKQGALGAAGVRDGLQLGRSVQRAGHIVSPRAQLIQNALLECSSFLKQMLQKLWQNGVTMNTYCNVS